MIEDAWSIAGGRPLRGRVQPSGSKNGTLPTLAATLLVEGEVLLHNVPRIDDVGTMLELLRSLGLRVERAEGSAVRIINHGIDSDCAPADLVGRMRASHYLLAPLLARLGRAELPLTGGCRIGRRPLDYIASALDPLGAEVSAEGQTTRATARRLTGARVSLSPTYRSPGATFSVLMAGVLARGTTVVENASYEPDVVAFCHFLRAAGAQIEGIGGPVLVIGGVDRLTGVSHWVNADRLEAGTLLYAAIATRGNVTVDGVTRDDLGAAADKLEEAGIEVSACGGPLRAACSSPPRAVSVITEPYPGFPTDLQPVFAAVLAGANGESTIRETIFDNRLQYAEQIEKMGATVRQVDSQCLVITGVDRLRGADVEAHNIRDGAAMVVAALSAEGRSRVAGRSFVARGYEDLDLKLRSLGADITRLGESPDEQGDRPRSED